MILVIILLLDVVSFVLSGLGNKLFYCYIISYFGNCHMILMLSFMDGLGSTLLTFSHAMLSFNLYIEV